jgi:hypothetical protein
MQCTSKRQPIRDLQERILLAQSCLALVSFQFLKLEQSEPLTLGHTHHPRQALIA